MASCLGAESRGKLVLVALPPWGVFLPGDAGQVGRSWSQGWVTAIKARESMGGVLNETRLWLAGEEGFRLALISLQVQPGYEEILCHRSPGRQW